MTDAGNPSGISYDDLPDAVVVADASGAVVALNGEAERLLVVDRGAAVGRSLEKVLPLEDLDGRPWWTCVRPYSGLSTRTGSPERLLLLPDGREVLATARYVRAQPLGPVVRVVVALRDTRARQRAERSRAELVSTVAHELRSPLTSVKGFTATLLAKWDRFTDEQKRLMLETVEADADRVTRLITELLDIARIDSGRLSLRRQVVDLGAAAARQVAGLVASGEPAERFVLETVPPLPELWADADKIDQVLGNLIGNAVSHGAGTVSILIDSADGEHTSVTVCDEGEGIPLEQQARVFTKWWRSGKRGGTGLGLYIVRGLVEAHGGSVTLGAGPSGGALFRFTLPTGRPEMPDDLSRPVETSRTPDHGEE